MSRTLGWSAPLAAVLVGLAAGPASAQFATPTIVLDYTYDQPANGGNNFFGAVGSPQRVALQAAATRLQSRLADTLSAIVPSGQNSWTTNTFHPGNINGPTIQINNLTIAQNEIRVFAGGQNLGTGGTLGIGGPGGWGASGFQPWFDLLGSRGQSGALAFPATDFGPWGGSITFNNTTNWNFSVENGPSFSQFDFRSVAEHELGHLLGIGGADSWDALINGSNQFTGPVTTALNGGVSPSVNPGRDHFAQGTTYLGQEVAMTPAISNGQRKLFTELDFAALDDIGWQVTPIPEPATVLGIAALGLAGVWRLRRRHTPQPPTGLAA